MMSLALEKCTFLSGTDQH